MAKLGSFLAVLAMVGLGAAAVIFGLSDRGNGGGDKPGGDPGIEIPPPPPTDPVDPQPADPEPSDPEPADPDTDDTDGPTDPTEPNEPVEPPAPEPNWSFYPPGNLKDGTGDGAATMTVFAPDMVFPIKDAEAFPQTQVYGPGGQVPGDQCQASNYEYPWRDNFCETRTSKWSTPYCVEQGVHLGQDIRAGTPEGCEQMRRQSPLERGIYAVVAAEDGIISNVGRYTVNVRAGGRIYRYLHLNMGRLQVSLGDEVKAGDVIGYLSNDFGGSATTFHLHFEIKMNTAEHGWTFVPPYLSLVEAYKRVRGNPGLQILDVDPDAGGVIGASVE